jgi:hypothetical protein
LAFGEAVLTFEAFLVFALTEGENEKQNKDTLLPQAESR